MSTILKSWPYIYHGQRHTNCDEHGFNCPPSLPALVPDDLFCTPFKCPERIPTIRYASPNSSLPPEELVHLKACIEEVNQLLRTLGNPREPDNPTSLRLHLRTLRGKKVCIRVSCRDQDEEILGCVQDAGRDFVSLDTFGRRQLIPFARLISFDREAETKQKVEHEPELMDINPCVRRSLVLRFGQIVSGNESLLNHFFGIPLYLQLAALLGRQVTAKVENEKEPIRGKLIDSQEQSIQLKYEEQVLQIELDKICWIAI